MNFNLLKFIFLTKKGKSKIIIKYKIKLFIKNYYKL